MRANGEQHWLVADTRMTRRAMLERAALAGGVLLAPGALAACGGDEGSTTMAEGQPRRGGELRTGHVGGGNVESLSPFTAPNVIDIARAQQLYELLFFTAPDLSVQPRLAESIEPNADATVWQLKLRSGVTWHDGRPFTADDVLYTWRYALDPANKAEAAPLLQPFDLKTTRKVSNDEIEIHLTQPVGDMPRRLAARPMYIVSDGATDFLKPNGTGPFKFVRWTQGVESTMTANKDYWGDGPYVDSLVMRSIPDSNARLNALLGGQIHAMESLDFTQAQAQEGNSAVSVLTTASVFTPPFTMRMDVPPFTDVRVRQAFKHAVDRDQMLEVALLGYGSIGNDLLGKGFPSYNDTLPQRSYDPEKAKSLLASAGHESLNVTLYTTTGIAGLNAAATAYVEQVKPAGINLTLRQLPPDAYFDPTQKYLSPSAPLYQSYWPDSFEQHVNDALLPNSPFRGETEWWRYSKSWAAEFRRAEGIPDEAERNAAYKELQEPLYDEGGYVVWGFQDLIDAVSSKLRGVEASPLFALGYFEFKDWWFAA